MSRTSFQQSFDALRPRLYKIAYRMLDSRPDVEDVLLDAWLRWRDTDHSVSRSAGAWLVSLVTRLAIDRLRAAQVERVSYLGEWLPESIVGWHAETLEAILERFSDLPVAFMHLLERLGSDERAAFLLREVFDYDYAEIAEMLGKNAVAVHQLVHRAGRRLRAGRPRFNISPEQHRRLLERFISAANNGDSATTWILLRGDAEVISDRAGRVSSQIVHE